MEAKLSGLTGIQQKILNSVIFFNNKFLWAFPSQDRIAAYAGVSRQYANQVLKLLAELGLIIKIYYPFKTCIYITSFFDDYNVRKIAARWLSACKFLSLRVIMAKEKIQKIAKSSNTTLFSRIISIYNNDYDTSHSKICKKERKMEISPSIKKLKELNLTLAGEISLSMFSDEVIEYAQKQLKYAKSARDRYKLFCYIAHGYCKANGIEPDYKHYFDLKKHYKVMDGEVTNLIAIGQANVKQIHKEEKSIASPCNSNLSQEEAQVEIERFESQKESILEGVWDRGLAQVLGKFADSCVYKLRASHGL